MTWFSEIRTISASAQITPTGWIETAQTRDRKVRRVEVEGPALVGRSTPELQLAAKRIPNPISINRIHEPKRSTKA